MTIIAALLVRRMQYIADKMRSITAMGTVTGSAFPQFCWKIRVLGLHSGTLMTIPAQLLHIFDQKICIGGLMRSMTGRTLSFGVRYVGILEFLWKSSVAVKANSGRSSPEQSGLV